MQASQIEAATGYIDSVQAAANMSIGGTGGGLRAEDRLRPICLLTAGAGNFETIKSAPGNSRAPDPHHIDQAIPESTTSAGGGRNLFQNI